MKKTILKFLGLDQVQSDLQSVRTENARIRTLLQDANDRIYLLTQNQKEL